MWCTYSLLKCQTDVLVFSGENWPKILGVKNCLSWSSCLFIECQFLGCIFFYFLLSTSWVCFFMCVIYISPKVCGPVFGLAQNHFSTHVCNVIGEKMLCIRSRLHILACANIGNPDFLSRCIFARFWSNSSVFHVTNNARKKLPAEFFDVMSIKVNWSIPVRAGFQLHLSHSIVLEQYN